MNIARKFRSPIQGIIKNARRFASKEDAIEKSKKSCSSNMKVTILGAGGNTGQPLALMMKQCPLLDELALYDVGSTCGLGVELSHVDTRCRVTAHSGREALCQALQHAKVVVVVASSNAGDSFDNNAPIIAELAMAANSSCPEAMIILATEPVESLLPLWAELGQLGGSFNPRRALGVMELNCVRANTLTADLLDLPPEKVTVPVIGGTSEHTIVPVLSRIVPPNLPQEQIECLTSSITGGTRRASLAGAFAVARTALNAACGIAGQPAWPQCAYVHSNVVPDCDFFCTEVVFGTVGVEQNLGVPELSRFEECLLWQALPRVRTEIARGKGYAQDVCASLPPEPVWQSCYTPPLAPPCPLPPRWAPNKPPNKLRDNYLETICAEVTCKCPTWRPREVDYEPPPQRASDAPGPCPPLRPPCGHVKSGADVEPKETTNKNEKPLGKKY